MKMRWLSIKKIKWNEINKIVIVTDGINFGYIRPEEIDAFLYENQGYVQGIPDSNSGKIKFNDIVFYFILEKPIIKDIND